MVKVLCSHAEGKHIGALILKARPQPEASLVADLIERRRQSRFKLAVEIVIHSKTAGLVKGQTVDLSENGISAILNFELTIGELVDLDFTLPFGRVTIYAVVRQRSAFRYGFRFAESSFLADVIRPTCRVLAMQQYIGRGI